MREPSIGRAEYFRDNKTAGEGERNKEKMNESSRRGRNSATEH